MGTPDTTGPADTTEGVPVAPPGHSAADEDRGVRLSRRAFSIAWPIALFAIILAIALNWFLAPAATEPLPGLIGEEPLPLPEGSLSGAAATDLLPERVLSYETITLQDIPGQEGRASEAIYVTLNMDALNTRPINSYARADVVASTAEAEQRTSEILQQYPLDQSDLLAGSGTVARQGFASDNSAWTVVWTRENVVYLVKTSYLDTPPVQRTRELLVNVGTPVVDGVADHEPSGE